MADMVVDSNIYDEVWEDLYVLEPEYEKLKAEIAKILDEGGTVQKNKMIEEYEKVVNCYRTSFCSRTQRSLSQF